MEVVVSSLGTIIVRVTPIDMTVIDKCSIENNATVWLKRASNYVSGIAGGAAVGRWTELPFRIRFDDKPSEIGNLPVDVVNFLAPPFFNSRIQRIKGIQAAHHFWAA